MVDSVPAALNPVRASRVKLSVGPRDAYRLHQEKLLLGRGNFPGAAAAVCRKWAESYCRAFIYDMVSVTLPLSSTHPMQVFCPIYAQHAPTSPNHWWLVTELDDFKEPASWGPRKWITSKWWDIAEKLHPWGALLLFS